MKKYFILRWIEVLALIFSSLALQAQTGIGTTTPDNNAMLDIQSTQKGVLLPRLNAAQQAVLAATLRSGQTGMLVRDSATGKLITWGGTNWTDVSTAPVTATAPLTVSNTNVVSLNPGTAAGDLITWDGINWVNMQPATQHFSHSVDNHQPYLVINFCISLFGIFPTQSDASQPFVGEIIMLGANFAPVGWQFCDGTLLSIAEYTVLFDLIGTTYGGDGITTFAVPDMRGRVPIHMGNNGTSTYTLGQQAGHEQETFSQ
jgi:microcystin-dependent protein